MTKITTVIGIILVLALVFIGGAYALYRTNTEEGIEVLEEEEDEDVVLPEDDSEAGDNEGGGTEAEEFAQWGNVVNIDELTAELVYEEPGKPALTVDLVFTMETLCVIDAQEATCPLFLTSPLFEQGARVYVEGEREGEIVVVRKITEEASY